MKVNAGADESLQNQYEGSCLLLWKSIPSSDDDRNGIAIKKLLIYLGEAIVLRVLDKIRRNIGFLDLRLQSISPALVSELLNLL